MVEIEIVNSDQELVNRNYASMFVSNQVKWTIEIDFQGLVDEVERCHTCNLPGHFSRNCKTPREEVCKKFSMKLLDPEIRKTSCFLERKFGSNRFLSCRMRNIGKHKMKLFAPLHALFDQRIVFGGRILNSSMVVQLQLTQI